MGGVSTSILKGNEYTGIKLEGGAVVWQAHNSRIYDGLTNGIRADDGSYIAVSGSSIHDNAYLAAAAFTNSGVDVPGNWWGQDPPSSSWFYADGGSWIDYSNWLPFDALPSAFFRIGEPSDQLTDGAATESDQTGTGDGYPGFTPVEPDQVRTLADLRAALYHTVAGQREGRLNELAGGLDPEWQAWVPVVRMELLQWAGQHRDLVNEARALLDAADYPAGVRRTIARRMFYSYLLGLQDAGQARAMIALLEELECEEAGSGQLSGLADFYGARFAESGHEPSLAVESGQTELQVSNHPNPFNPVTTLRYTLPEAGEASLSVYNIQGQRVATLAAGQHAQGTHSAVFDAGRLASGVYLYRLATSAGVVTGKMLLIK
jgi:hypothetical protein